MNVLPPLGPEVAVTVPPLAVASSRTTGQLRGRAKVSAAGVRARWTATARWPRCPPTPTPTCASRPTRRNGDRGLPDDHGLARRTPVEAATSRP
ncbi:Uncharacterised protein [Amycolatopsis camponoti]|uniref:Uncharacterized protein n=1 Tax=Amycolatopsis camponoti TaxID=2606593 RepID=A0A6I8M2E0_9PSEU|nr:Uncharacterised protein [Amycolatopsis camponoti]